MGLITILTMKQFEFQKSKMADGHHFDKTIKPPYLHNHLTDFDEILHVNAHRAP